ncbi:TetR/AcrR family transcriptional regulator [Paenirhodobacter sp. CAU 1674]|jgi:AcrR family transcriptional regulator|uniref:TetR/AcrR family transcriptional regulator n=1 Tax=Paenirhodobacter sp. CAU 1674 TaxID=3032596 RepID=UPI0023D9F08E|nr:TetR/AcrR family transcriptional regulator [Paenirhodobacter sp. CAU 1674]MDF2142879.1 TetR/AcrR family transcriptional regulator [Paenirhodobacter sp. CAU 1674]
MAKTPIKAVRPDQAEPVPGDRRRNREVKREAVLAAAVSAFNEKGFRAASLDDVAARLGVTKPTIYHYARNKDEILFDCVKRGLEIILEAIAALPQDKRLGRDRLEAAMTGYAFAMTQDFCRCVTRTADTDLAEPSRKEFRKLKRHIDDVMRGLVQAGMDDGSLRAGDARIVTFTLTGALNWIGRWYEPTGQLSRDAVTSGVVATLMAGLSSGV